jgi:hypothetical protein
MKKKRKFQSEWQKENDLKNEQSLRGQNEKSNFYALEFHRKGERVKNRKMGETIA